MWDVLLGREVRNRGRGCGDNLQQFFRTGRGTAQAGRVRADVVTPRSRAAVVPAYPRPTSRREEVHGLYRYPMGLLRPVLWLSHLPGSLICGLRCSQQLGLKHRLGAICIAGG